MLTLKNEIVALDPWARVNLVEPGWTVTAMAEATLAGTGIVAGQVFDAGHRPVPQARIYGLVKPKPTETPFSFAETYGDKGHAHPLYGEHFAVGDVPAGRYVIGTEIDGKQVLRDVTVAAGKVTWVVFSP